MFCPTLVRRELSATTLRSLHVALYRVGHVCTGPCSLFSPALGHVWFTWPALTLIVLQSEEISLHGSFLRAVNRCALKDHIRVRARSVDDRGHALAAMSSSAQRRNRTPLDATGRPILGASIGAPPLPAEAPTKTDQDGYVPAARSSTESS